MGEDICIRSEHLDEIIAQYLQSTEAGQPLDREELLGRYPELAAELQEFFADQDRFARIAAPLKDPLPRRQFVPPTVRYFGGYELLDEIARGGMGVVYRARQIKLNRTVAVKMILSGHLATEEDVKRFQSEAEAAANLQHPSIVSVHEVGQHAGHHYFSMDYVEGRSLAELVRDGPLPPRRAAAYVRQAAEAIHHAHQQGTLHRDLKPSNLLIDGNDQVRITDFGLAMRVEGDSELTRTGQVLGSPSYMPPEQAQGKRSLIGPGSDVYALGAVLYELLTGRPPFRGDSAVETIQQVVNSEPVSPRLLNQKVPRDLETICLKCLQKEPHKRYGTAQLLADDLGRYARGEPIDARQVGPFPRLLRWFRKRSPVEALFWVGCSIGLMQLLAARLNSLGVLPYWLWSVSVAHFFRPFWLVLFYSLLFGAVGAFACMGLRRVWPGWTVGTGFRRGTQAGLIFALLVAHVAAVISLPFGLPFLFAARQGDTWAPLLHMHYSILWGGLLAASWNGMTAIKGPQRSWRGVILFGTLFGCVVSGSILWWPGRDGKSSYSRIVGVDAELAVEHYTRGRDHHRNGDLDRAIVAYTEAIRLKSDYADPYYNRGVAYAAEGDLDLAIADYDEAIRLEPDYAAVYCDRALAHLSKGDFQQAIADCEKAIALERFYTMAYHYRGVARLKIGDFSRALSDFDKVLASTGLSSPQPAAAELYHYRGVARQNLGDIDGAISEYSYAIRQGATDAAIYFNRGLAQHTKGASHRAIADFDEAIRLRPDDAAAYCLRGSAYLTRGDIEKAIADCSESIRLEPGYAPAHHYRGSAHLAAGNVSRAVADYSEAIRLDPSLAHAHYGRGRAYESSGDLDRATMDYQRARELGLKVDRSLPFHAEP